jgi:hypothetical protein
MTAVIVLMQSLITAIKVSSVLSVTGMRKGAGMSGTVVSRRLMDKALGNNGRMGGNTIVTQNDKPSSPTSSKEGDPLQKLETMVPKCCSANNGRHAKLQQALYQYHQQWRRERDVPYPKEEQPLTVFF